jgi:hypothetical protein
VKSVRRLVIDGGITWWVGIDGNCWHETVGVFLLDPSGRAFSVERRNSCR